MKKLKIFICFYLEIDDTVGEYFVVADKQKSKEHMIHFSVSIRGKPAIMVDNFRFIVMYDNAKRVLWRCSLMSTKTRKVCWQF